MNRPIATQTHQQKPTATPIAGGLLQRKCACGSHTISGGECAECSKKQTLQRASLSSRGRGIEGEGRVPPIVHEVLRSAGQLLSPATRAFVESRFGHDFSQVKVHTNAKAAESAQEINAKAYTVGRHVVFGAHRYAPHTKAGLRLLAHELAHVVQQGTADASGSLSVAPASSEREREAESAAQHVTEAGASPGAPIRHSAGIRIDRQKDDPEAESKELLKKQAKAEADILADLAKGKQAYKQAVAILDKAAGGKVDSELVDMVREQGSDVEETSATLEEFSAALADMDEQNRRTIMGAAAIELQLFIRNAEHLMVMDKVVSLELPSNVENAEEIEEILDEFADWHESWIEVNLDVAEFAHDLVGVLLGIEEQTEVKEPVAEMFAEFNERLKVEGEALVKVNGEIDSLTNQAEAARQKQERMEKIQWLIDIVEFIRALRGRGGGRVRPRGGGKGTTTPKKTKTVAKGRRKQLRKGSAKSSRPKRERGQRRKKRKEKRGKIHPICWATQFGGPPMLFGVPVVLFVRTPGVERDTQDAYQQRLKLVYKRQDKDPDFRGKLLHVHHIVPLFLGGLDAAPGNLVLVPAGQHLRGHAILNYQPQLAKTLGSPYLTAHPAGTRYRLAGFKSEASERCGR